jgi:hypothetical protein
VGGERQGELKATRAAFPTNQTAILRLVPIGWQRFGQPSVTATCIAPRFSLSPEQRRLFLSLALVLCCSAPPVRHLVPGCFGSRVFS